MMPEVNYVAILISAVAAMMVGYAWYGPLFGKQWMALNGWTKESMAAMSSKNPNMGKLYAIQALASLVMAYVFSHILVFATSYMKTSGASAGIVCAFWVWLGFIAPVMLGKVLWEGKPWKLWILDAGHYLVTLSVMGLILTAL